MKNYQFKIYCLVILCFITNTILAQQSIIANENETLELRGTTLENNQTIQWQESLDNSSWQDITGGNTLFFEVTLQNLPNYFRAKITDLNCNEDVFTESITVNLSINSEDKLLWSDPDTWGAEGKPVAGDDVMIPEDKHIYLDEDTPELGEVMIDGVCLLYTSDAADE